jgi:putative ABC transport system permease protein
MILNFVLRNLRRRPFLNLIKVGGLVLAFSSMLLIALYMKHELSYDRFHAASDRIYRFTATSPTAFSGKHFARIWGARYIPELAGTFPEVENYVRLSPVSGGLIQWEEKKVLMQQAFLCDSTFLKIFDAQLLLGDPEEVLAAPSSLLISESFAKKIFGDENPVGQVLTIPTGRYYGEASYFQVSGLMKDFPANSHLHPEFVATPPDPTFLDGWAWTYLLLHPGAEPSGIISGFKSFLADFGETEVDEVDYEAHLQSIKDIHLHSQKTREIEGNSNMAIIYSFSIAVMILLFIALVNYGNLNLGMLRFSDDLMFVGRVFGASRRQQLKYFVYEGLTILFLAILLSLVLVKLSAMFIESRFNLNLLEGNIIFILLLLGGIGLLGFASGFLPQVQAYFVTLLASARNTSGGPVRKRNLNRGLIVFQYTIATVLIVSVLVIQRQTSYALQSGMGAENSGIICMKHVHSSIVERFPEFKKALLQFPSIRNVSGMLDPPGGDANDMFRFSLEGYEPDESNAEDQLIGILPCDYSMPSLFDLRFLAGRDFSEEFIDAEGSGEYIINESALERLGYSHPSEIIDREFQLFFHNDFIQIPAGRIIGVVEDFHLSSLKREIEPLVLFKRDTMWVDNLLVSYSPGNLSCGLKDTEKTWEERFPGHTFNYDFVDSMYRQVYLVERMQAMLLLMFTLIALFICSMGLLGLSLLASQQRIKEIGIRRVNGAEISGIVRMLNRDFLKWVLLSYILAMPLAWLGMRRWLEGFAYQTELSWWIFLLAGLIALFLSAVPVSIQSWKAARRNPVKALRYE